MRCFKIPATNFLAWHFVRMTDPSLTKHMTEEESKNQIVLKSKITFEKFPCQTQAMKKMIKEVADTSLSGCGSKALNKNKIT